MQTHRRYRCSLKNEESNFSGRFSTTLSNPIGIRLVLLGLVVMPTTELVLPFDVDCYRLTPTTSNPVPPMLLPF
jgi:hypothetical protein